MVEEDLDNELENDDGDKVPTRRTKPRIGSDNQRNGDVENVDNEIPGTSIYERIKRRRQQQQPEDSEPPAKRINVNDDRKQGSSESEEEEPRRYFFRNRAQVTRMKDGFNSMNNKIRHGHRSVHFSRRRSSSGKHRRHRRHDSISSESSSTSDSDLADAERDFRAELKFEKRKLRSLQVSSSRHHL